MAAGRITDIQLSPKSSGKIQSIDRVAMQTDRFRLERNSDSINTGHFLPLHHHHGALDHQICIMQDGF